MKNIAVCFTGGCGGNFIFYYLLASEKFSHQPRYTSSIIQPRHLEDQFYYQFREHSDWITREFWPDNYYDRDNQLFLCCNYLPDSTVNCIKICPYISNKHDWFRTILFKKTNYFRDMNVRSINFVKQVYKKVKASPPDLKPEGCDYYFDIIKFTHDYTERKKLCDFLQIEINDRMEQFVTHYQKLHTKLKKTDWVKKNNIDNQSKYIL